MKKKIFITLFLLFVLLTNISFASYSTVTMSVVEEPICSIELGGNSQFEKKLISKDLNNKEVTIQLQVTNGEEPLKPTGEIVLLLDNSESMNNKLENGKTRKDLIFNSAKTLVSNLLIDNESLKIGIVSFSTNTDMSKEGSIEDATVVSKLSNNSIELNNAISNIEANGPRTNLESGLALASQQFSSENNNKYMIVLTDGIPNVAIDYDKTYYSDDVITKTKSKLQDLDSKGINVITMLTGIEDENYIPNGVTKTFKEIITGIFGTSENPTVGDFYYVTDDKIEETIKTNIYNSLMPIKRVFNDIKIIDYFPAEIINNFDFAYVSESNIGEISATIDTTNNSITWTIPELSNAETATVQYKLKLKENFDNNIIDKILNTNEKVDITFKDFDNADQSKTSDISPKLKLELLSNNLPTVLPAAGSSTTFIVLSFICIVCLIVSFIRFKNINNNLK